MKWREFALRAVVMSAVVIAFAFTTGLGSILRTFAIGVTASLASHAVLLGVRRLAGDDKASWLITGACVVVAAGAATFVVLDSRGPVAPLRYRTVDELMDYPGGYVTKPMKLHGFLEHGSRTRDGFVLQENGKRVRVLLRGPAPEVLRDGLEVVATGYLRRTGAISGEFEFVADEISAKCPSTYDTPSGPRPASEFR